MRAIALLALCTGCESAGIEDYEAVCVDSCERGRGVCSPPDVDCADQCVSAQEDYERQREQARAAGCLDEHDAWIACRAEYPCSLPPDPCVDVDNAYYDCIYPRYQRCEDSFECTPGVECIDVGGSFCTYYCRDDFDCVSHRGFEARCADPHGGAPVCYQTCEEDADCTNGSSCREATRPDGAIERLCFPTG